MRLGSIFVAACMALIAASAGAIAYSGVGLNGTWAAGIGFAVFALLVVGKPLLGRFKGRSVTSRQLSDLSGGVADLARQVGEMGRRLAALEAKVQRGLERAQPMSDPLAIEIGELGALFKQLAETVATHEAALTELHWSEPPAVPAKAASLPMFAPAAPAPAVPIPAVSAPAPAPGPLAATPGAAVAIPAQLAVPTESVVIDEVESEAETRLAAELAAEAAAGVARAAEQEALAAIRGAIEANRLDLYLQPIVTLPQRKVRYYEAMSRLRTEKGDLLQGADFIARAESGGLIAKIDNLAVFRSVQVVRRLQLKNRDVGLFCNLSPATLNDPIVFPQLLEFFEANRAIAPSLVLEITEAALREAGPLENESFAALAERGFRFSIDNVVDLRMEPRELAERGVRFIKIPASLLLGRSGTTTGSDIHPADLSDLLGRFGIELIAEKIESESMVVDLLDYDVRYGQGFLFSPPRPVRAEALQGSSERGDLTARADAGPGAANPAPRPAETARPATGGAARSSGLAQLARNVGRV
jgi:cyclic-di-GMP phosphodiesterase TipF (flagellum assembly factor)